MRTAGALPSVLRHAPFTAAQARSAGVSPDRLRRRDIRRLHRGVYVWTGAGVPGSPSADGTGAPGDEVTRGVTVDPRAVSSSATSGPSPLSPAMRERLAALAVVHPDVVVTGPTAARHWGWPLPRRLERTETVHVLRGADRGPVRLPLVATRRMDGHDGALDTEELEGLGMTDPAETWFQLARRLSEDELIAVGDHLARSTARRRAPIAEVATLRACLERHRGDAGIRRARAALELVRSGSDSPPETELRLALLRAGLPEPALQIELWDPEYSFDFPASADMGYPDAKIAIQYEGAHHDGAARVSGDTRRDAVFQRDGWLVIRVAAEDRQQGFRQAVALVRAAVTARATR